MPGSTKVTGGASIDFVPNPYDIAASFELFGLDVRSFREPLTRSIRQVVIPSIGKNFEEGGRPGWHELASQTVEIHRGGSARPILVRTGLLKRVAQQLNLWSIGIDTATYDFSGARSGAAWYGGIQNTGFQGGGGAVTPARPFIMLQDADTYDIEDVFYTWIRERAITAGFDPFE